MSVLSIILIKKGKNKCKAKRRRLIERQKRRRLGARVIMSRLYLSHLFLSFVFFLSSLSLSRKEEGQSLYLSHLFLSRRMNQSAIPPLLLDFSSMMTPSESLSVAPPQGREISSKTPNLFVDLSSTMNHWTCRSVPLLEASASLSRSSTPIPNPSCIS